MKPIQRIRRHYTPNLRRGGANHEVLDWASAESQQARFEVLAREVDLAGRSLLDVGCGLGDLAGFLQERGIEVNYTGIDVLPEMLERARLAHPQLPFVEADLFQGDSPFAAKSFDVVFCSGALNLNLDNNLAFAARALPTMFALCRQALVVNFLHARARAYDARYFHYDPAEMVDILESLCASVRLVDDYLPHDFTLIARP